MKPCTRCSNTLTADATYCHVCNSEQTEVKGFDDFDASPPANSVFLKVLCILTIAGAGISLISVVFNLVKKPDHTLGIIVPAYTYVIGVVVALGKIMGASLMLKKKLNGLYIYSVAAVISLGSAIYSTFTVSDQLGSLSNTMASSIVIVSAVVSMFFILAFIVMFWLPINKKHLS